MTNLNVPSIKSGPLTIAELHEARQHSTGRILAAGCSQQGRFITRRHPGMTYEPWTDTVPTDWGCAVEGGQHREPSKTIRPPQWTGLALVLLGWPAIAAIVGAVAWVIALA